MVQCTNGSRPQAAAPAYFWFTWSAFIAWLAIRFARFGTIVWAFFGDQTKTVADFCATEPVIPTAPTLAQWLGFFTLDFAARVYVEQYLLACFAAYLWPTYCECIPAAAGTCYTLLPTGTYGTTSSDMQNYRFGYEWYAKVAGLFVYGVTIRFATVGTGTFKIEIHDQHAGTVHTESFAGVAGLHTYELATPQAIPNTGAGNVMDTVLRWENTGYSFTYENINVTPADSTQEHANKFIYQSDLTSGMIDWSPNHLPMDTQLCTAGGPGGTPITYTPPLPVDPTDIPDHPEFTCTTTADLCSRVNALQSALAVQAMTTNWLQSQLAPTCWVPGTPHAGLTGAGTIAVAEVVGAYVTMAIPTVWGRTNETPARAIPKAGELQFAVDGVVADDHQLHYDAEQILGAPAAANSIVYNFRLGVTGSITPLQRCK